jgi:hypothetical protein
MPIFRRRQSSKSNGSSSGSRSGITIGAKGDARQSAPAAPASFARPPRDLALPPESDYREWCWRVEAERSVR